MILRKLKQNYLMISLLLAFTCMAVLAKKFGLLINVTPSMPFGLYIEDHRTIGRGDVVSMCLAEPHKTLAIRMGYIREGGSGCKGVNSLIKEVIALPGDDVVLKDDYIIVNKQKYLFPTKYIDSHGRKLQVYPRGVYSNTSGYWTIGVNDKNSWDSRYFGPVEKRGILNKLRPLITW